MLGLLLSISTAVCRDSHPFTLSPHIWIELLKDELSEVDLVGPTLPALKTLLVDLQPMNTQHDRYEQLIHGLLSSCLLNIDAMRYPFFLLQARWH
jgi:hypothetical protein